MQIASSGIRSPHTAPATPAANPLCNSRQELRANLPDIVMDDERENAEVQTAWSEFLASPIEPMPDHWPTSGADDEDEKPISEVVGRNL